MAAKDGSNTHTVEEGDTMSSIAGEYYGNVNQYAVIANAKSFGESKQT